MKFTDCLPPRGAMASDIRPFVAKLDVRIAQCASGRTLNAANFGAVDAIVDYTVKTTSAHGTCS